MRIIVTGGGTGGHVTPLKPVISELKKLDPQIEIMYVGQKGDRFADLIDESDVSAKMFIQSGKYRRYPDEPMWQRILDFQTHALNFRDLFRIAAARIKSKKIIADFKPDVVFGNGGYVSVPLGLAASAAGIPLVIHESDAKPGMATNLLASRASKVLSGVPTRHTTFKGKPLQYVGIPLRDVFVQKEKLSKAEIKKKLGFSADLPLITVSGSSLGAEAINNAVTNSISRLLDVAQVAHITGKDHLESVTQSISDANIDESKYQAIDFANNIDMYFKASDIVFNRASATIFTELAALGRATILIPAPQLSDQIENAEILSEKGVVQVIEQSDLEQNPELLVNRVVELLTDKKEMQRLEKAIKKLAKPEAAQEVAKTLFSYCGEDDGETT
jgi:UDP-N-acetylglucosamine--N-acetylmuramyl-(pentapeptide) pyrophosphoryl-undecaprenol N-acetylglucosamine transferase